MPIRADSGRPGSGRAPLLRRWAEWPDAVPPAQPRLSLSTAYMPKSLDRPASAYAKAADLVVLQDLGESPYVRPYGSQRREAAIVVVLVAARGRTAAAR